MFFIVFFVLVNYVVLNLVIAVVLETLELRDEEKKSRQRGQGLTDLHSSTFRLNASAFYRTGVALRGSLEGVPGVTGGGRGYQGVCRVSFCFRNGSG